MSKAELAERILSVLKTLPKDRIKHYASFKDVQIARFLDAAFIEKTPEEDLKLQYIALRDLVNDKYKNYYKLDDKLLKPKGNPQYYDRIMSEIKGEKKETWLSAMRTVVFGK
ncbi:hypothetical protein PUMCH_002468 [Australozyma saopauloensis]|uniref:Cytochrome B pre-mRNA-processing protein 6 n=1 Tax=Australozyma saopauloensis TaxID=291208 RepID=A0AAX4H9F7_9ASCO|nr:hypothetical protein PUMCH_002468 [[Candida] saopauloensis]